MDGLKLNALSGKDEIWGTDARIELYIFDFSRHIFEYV
jgi:hypothetical protein